MKPDVSVIIVNYNTGRLLRNCLASIAGNIRQKYEVIVVDNHSADDSLSMCSEFWGKENFRLERLDRNYGFSRANNVGAGLARGSVFHFLNPDTELQEGINRDYETALAHPENVYVNPLVNRDGSYENDRMPVPVLRNIRLWNSGSGDAAFWYKGASVMISADNFRRIGGWCEDYFLFAEDLDLFYEISRHGIPVRVAESEIFHLGGGSTSSMWSALRREIQVEKSNRLFFRKHFSRTEYLKSKLYYLFHHSVRRPGYVPRYLAAWFLSLWR